MLSAHDRPPKYERLDSPSGETLEDGLRAPRMYPLREPSTRKIAGWTIFAAILGFVAGVLSIRIHAMIINCHAFNHLAPRIPLQNIPGEFTYPTPFSEEPPQGEGAGQIAEPIWDSLVPNGLGYFKDESLAPQVSIPTVFHQLHCLYVIRRAYYSQSDDVQPFDLGKNRAAHLSHCFDYLQQSITCAADTTIEPAEGKMNAHLGSGVTRQCRNFEQLKDFVAERRAFNATGFLAREYVYNVD
ncbi:hypothetical protein DTO271D3_1420 [Paecilomyces variotii]|nr:hypothetical protein DTO169C6_51 [Paecilomyces variotii]KAJ9297424.1 hypothetical protein DTO217A2_8631 [Paecilomyces variotii]KAJ9318163.1 hypothetical protein DTO271D3_1420 [Paecilomyces variotii]